ncbi:MAG: DUF4266 domain-containing protein, partial [Pseudomonadota bacterium]
MVLLFACVASQWLVTGCATIKPWDRDLLAEEKMQLVPHPLDNFLDEHIYFSKEAA